MHLVSAKVSSYKSIEQSKDVKIEEKISVLVGMNESGKTVFLEALQKSDDIFDIAKFNYIDDYPRKDLSTYERRHEAAPDTVTVLTYQLNDSEVDSINRTFHTQLPRDFQFSISRDYKNQATTSLSVDDKPAIAELAKGAVSTDFRDAIRQTASFREIPEAVAGLSLIDEDKQFLAAINKRIETAAQAHWNDVVGYEVFQHLKSQTPKFMYFGDYEILPSKMNLADLAKRVSEEKTNPRGLTSQHRGILALLRMANISIDDFAKPGPIEALIARIESVSIRLTDEIMEFWKQNEDLEVKVDIRPDPSDEPPYNNGSDLYIRIANKRHRGVTTPFTQRSHGFIWFFSFLVWFDSVQHQLEEGKDKNRPLILLLDEPGLSLHALAQADFLRYIDNLAERHQVIYTTHSPFMIHSDRLYEVRSVEDRPKIGTVISDNISWTDERTIFPLQAALGWTIAQNLFISERNLLVEGSADLIYLQTMSSILESQGRISLREDVTIVPTGGLDKVVTFIALLGANKLKLVVFHDFRRTQEQKLLELVREKMISPKSILNASQFRDLTKVGISGLPSDTEDLFEPATYLKYFSAAFVKELSGKKITELQLPPGDRIVDRLERYASGNAIQLRPRGGSNHYRPATVFARDPSAVDSQTVDRFEALFKAVNSLF